MCTWGVSVCCVRVVLEGISRNSQGRRMRWGCLLPLASILYGGQSLISMCKRPFAVFVRAKQTAVAATDATSDLSTLTSHSSVPKISSLLLSWWSCELSFACETQFCHFLFPFSYVFFSTYMYILCSFFATYITKQFSGKDKETCLLVI